MSTSTKHADRTPPAQRVTEAILRSLERGVRPWSKPWRDTGSFEPAILPRRANGELYRGINVIALWAAATEAGYSSPDWFTFKQALALGGQVRKGERGSYVVFYKPMPQAQKDDTDNDNDTKARSVLRGYVVFNRAQIEGLKTEQLVVDQPADESVDMHARRFATVPATLRLGGARAFYAPSTDHVQLPPRDAFIDPTQFYATLAHELGHWTRHPSRLNRDFGQKRFGDRGYALEELVAELCAAFVGAAVGLPSEHIEDHAAYIEIWLEVLQDSPSAFLTAAGKAQVAADYLLRFMNEVDPDARPKE